MDESKIIPYVDPIFRFCYKRLSNRYDAEDLASEILYHILDGMRKYQIDSVDAWVWRIAYNRYARFINDRNKHQIILSGDYTLFDIADESTEDDDHTQDEYASVFRYLHTLSSEYKNIFVDYYIGDLSIRGLAKKYSLPETTIKWRLNIGRQKIKARIGEDRMDKVYKRINWHMMCNGNTNPDDYLHTQIARAICLATYEKPLSIEEISIRTGIPTMYIEDEIPRLEYGDAISKVGNKYVTEFIIFRTEDKSKIKEVSRSIVDLLADQLEEAMTKAAAGMNTLEFYGKDFGMDRLGYIVLPYLLRRMIREAKSDSLKLEDGCYPQRKDGSYGWFIVEETADENENSAEYNSGCNSVWSKDKETPLRIHCYWISKYFCHDVYGKGIWWMCDHKIMQKSHGGLLPRNILSDEDAANLISLNLIAKTDGGYTLNFPYFTANQFTSFIQKFHLDDEKIKELLSSRIISVHKSFESFVPKHLHDQINQWVTGYLNQIIGYVADELIRRGTLRKPDLETPLTDGIFCVEGSNILP